MFPFLAGGHGSSTEIFIAIMILLGLSLLISVVLGYFKINFLPKFTVEIIVGLAIGAVFNSVVGKYHQEGIVEGLYVFGLAFLLFLSGLDADFTVFKDRRRNTKDHINVVTLSILTLIAIYGLSFGASWFFVEYFVGGTWQGIVLLTITLSASFASVIVPMIHQSDVCHTTIGNYINTVSTLSELVSIILLSIFMIANGISSHPNPWLYIVVAIILVLMYLFHHASKIKHFEFMKKSFGKLNLRAIVFILLILIYVSELAGGEFILGAFLAGMAIRLAKPKEEVVKKLEFVGYGLFIPVFFIIIGTRIDITLLFSDTKFMLLTLVLFLLIIITKAPIMILMKWYKFGTSFVTTLLLSCGIIVAIAAKSMGIFSDYFSYALMIASVLTCIISPLVFRIKFPYYYISSNYEEASIGSHDSHH
ncbi:MAG TPA: cation:proton antiporter [Bacilli bacterium]|nr:cation:proton antiporter [Bacilli bacterium]